MKRKWACVYCGSPAILKDAALDEWEGQEIVDKTCNCRSSGFYAFPDPPMEGLKTLTGIIQDAGEGPTPEEWGRYLKKIEDDMNRPIS